ncbi:MAG TPA: sulfatase-like hydrolase/transferase, partial [Terrimicrobiaceae bacterium]|nr:sulfatase-like hydrolase/transferase [Terrimicrobiaceae bacterium]
YFERVIADRAADFVRRHRDRDFLCFLSMVAPHGPFTPPERILRGFSAGDIPLRPRSPHELEGKPPAFQRWIRQNQAYLNDAELGHFLAVMAALVALVDEQVGRILDVLEEEGIAEETLIVFTSDHGDFSSAYGVIGKSWCMDDLLLRIPLIVAGPGGLAGSSSAALVQNCDILPFLLEYSGLSCPVKVQGRSFGGSFADPSQAHRDAVFACQSNEFSGGRLVQSMVVRDGWKYVESTPECPQLFDLINDPMEWVNLAGRRDTADRELALRGDLLQWHLEVSGGFFRPEVAGFWEDETCFYNEKLFTGERIRPTIPGSSGGH